MKILVDISTNNSIFSGVSRYALNILHGFTENGFKDIIILASPQIYNYVKEIFPNYKCIKSEYKKGGMFSNLIRLSRQINQIDCDIVFATVPGKFLLGCKKPIVQTIHDLQYFLSSGSLNASVMKWIMPFILIKSKKIITISNFVGAEIKRHYPFVPKTKLYTIYNSVYLPTLNLPITRKNYILYVSRLEKTKNVLTLLKAFNLIKNKTDVNLKLIGKGNTYWHTELYPYIVKNDLEKRVELISESLSDRELFKMYQESKMLVHPSIAEGFGYTPIEAAILCTPVITTKMASLYETTKGLLRYCDDPYNPTELAEQILSVLEYPPSADSLNMISRYLAATYNCKTLSADVYNLITQ